MTQGTGAAAFSWLQAVNKNRWFQVRSVGRWKPRLKASFQRRSARGISERGRMVAIRLIETTMTAGMVGRGGQTGRGGVWTAGHLDKEMAGGIGGGTVQTEGEYPDFCV